MKRAVVLLVVLGLRSLAVASGHGPVFGLATPTNSQGEWSFDEGVFGRSSSLGSQASVRTLIAYGFTPHLTLSFTLPAVVGDTLFHPRESSRVVISTPQSHGAFSTERQRSEHVLKALRSAGLAVPGPQSGFKGIAHTSNVPGTMFGLVSGMASRSHYVWLGGTYTKFYEHNGDKRPDVLDYSLVYGYRPEKWRRPPDKWDWRLFGELVGERSDRFLQANIVVPNTQAHQVFLGPTALGIFHNYTVSFGAQFPIYQNVGSAFPKERVRFAFNISYLLFQHGNSH